MVTRRGLLQVLALTATSYTISPQMGSDSEDQVLWSYGLNPSHTFAYEDATGPKRNPEVDWQFKVTPESEDLERDQVIYASPAYADGELYFGSWNGRFYAIDIESGEELWRYEVSGEEDIDLDIIPDIDNQFGSSPTVTENYIYTGNFNGEVIALNRDGEEEWTYSTNGHVRSSPEIVGDSLLIGSYDNSLYNLDRYSGSQNWSYETGGFIYASPTVVDDLVYFGTLNFDIDTGILHAVNLQTGESEWTLETDGVTGTTIVHSEDLFFGTWAGTVYRVSPDGTVVWTKDVEADVAGATATNGDLVFVPTRGGWLHALAKESGSIEWEYQAGDEFYGVSAVIADNVVYIGNNDGKMYAFKTDSGEKLWEYETDGLIRSSPVIRDGKMYFGSHDGHLYAIEEGPPEQEDEDGLPGISMLGTVATAGATSYYLAKKSRRSES